jgi:hypothetical protein
LEAGRHQFEPALSRRFHQIGEHIVAGYESLISPKSASTKFSSGFLLVPFALLWFTKTPALRAVGLFTRNEARRIAANVAKLPELLRKS